MSREEKVRLVELLEKAENRWEIAIEVAKVVPELPTANVVIGYADAERIEIRDVDAGLAAGVCGLSSMALTKVRKEKSIPNLACYLAALREEAHCPDWILQQQWPKPLHRHLIALLAAVTYRENNLEEWLRILETNKTSIKKNELQLAVLTALVHSGRQRATHLFSDWWEFPENIPLDILRCLLAKNVSLNILLKTTLHPNATFHISSSNFTPQPGRRPSTLASFAPTLTPEFFDHDTIKLRLEAISRCRKICNKFRFCRFIKNPQQLLSSLEQVFSLLPGASKAERTLILDTLTAATTLMERSLRIQFDHNFIKFQTNQLLALVSDGGKRTPLSAIAILERLYSIMRLLQYDDQQRSLLNWY